MKTMTKKNLIQLSFLFLGVAFAVLGILSPWKCYRGFVHMCLPGLSFDWTVFLAFKVLQVIFLLLTIGGIYYAFMVGKTFREDWQTLLSSIIIGILIFFLVTTPVVIDGGGFVFLLGTVAAMWLILSNHQQMAIGRIVPILLVIFSTLNLFEPMGSSLAQKFPGEIESTGRVLLFVGALLILGASLARKQQAQQDAA